MTLQNIDICSTDLTTPANQAQVYRILLHQGNITLQNADVPSAILSHPPLQTCACQYCYYIRSCWDVEQSNWECSEQSDINMTNITVKSYTVVYLCMEVMISQSQMSPEMFMICQTHRMGGHQNTSHRRRHVEETLPAFGMTLQNPSYSKHNIPNLPKSLKYGHYTFLYLSIWQIS